MNSNPAKARNFVLTNFNTQKYEDWKNLTDDRIRLLSYQLESTKAGKVHIQGYLEVYGPMSFSGVKKLLGDNKMTVKQRNGPRMNAYMYTKKEETPWWETNYPQWIGHGGRIPGTSHHQIGTFSNRQGERTDIQRVVDMVEAGATETEIALKYPREYIKFGAGINRLLSVRARALRGKHRPVKVIVRWGDTRTGKTRKAKDEHSYQKVFTPVWNGTKFWFDGYQGEPVLQINEVDTLGWTTKQFQDLTDNYIQLLEYKGGVTASNWHTIVLTSNVSPAQWWDGYASVPQAVEDSIIERIDEVEHMVRKREKKKTWADLGVTEPSITSVTSVPQKSPAYSVGKCQGTNGKVGGRREGEVGEVNGVSRPLRLARWSALPES